MSITELGIEGEQKARLFLKQKGYELLQADWIGKKNNKYVLFEIKHKERFKPPPFEGHGLNIYQIKARLEFQKNTGIRCLLIIFEPNSPNVYYQWLDKLENGINFDTKNKVRIYPLNKFDFIENLGIK